MVIPIASMNRRGEFVAYLLDVGHLYAGKEAERKGKGREGSVETWEQGSCQGLRWRRGSHAPLGKYL